MFYLLHILSVFVIIMRSKVRSDLLNAVALFSVFLIKFDNFS